MILSPLSLVSDERAGGRGERIKASEVVFIIN